MGEGGAFLASLVSQMRALTEVTFRPPALPPVVISSVAMEQLRKALRLMEVQRHHLWQSEASGTSFPFPWFKHENNHLQWHSFHLALTLQCNPRDRKTQCEKLSQRSLVCNHRVQAPSGGILS